MSKSHGRRGAKRSKRSVAEKRHRIEPIPSSAVVSLTPQGLEFFQLLLDSASAEVGCKVTGEDLLEALQRVRAETGIKDPRFTDAAIVACFKKHLQALAGKRHG